MNNTFFQSAVDKAVCSFVQQKANTEVENLYIGHFVAIKELSCFWLKAKTYEENVESRLYILKNYQIRKSKFTLKLF